MDGKCLKAERRINEKRRNSRLIDAFRSRLLEKLPFGFAAPSVSLKAQKNRGGKDNYSHHEPFLSPPLCEQTRVCSTVSDLRSLDVFICSYRG